MRSFIQGPVVNVKYSMSGIQLYVAAFICVWSLALHQAFLYHNNLTLIIGACHIHLYRCQHQILRRLCHL